MSSQSRTTISTEACINAVLACSIFLEVNRYINEGSRKRYKIAWPPDSCAIFGCIEVLKSRKADVDADAIAVSVKQNSLLMEKVRMLMDKVVIEPKAKLPCHLLTYPENPGFPGREQTLNRMMNALKLTPGKLKSYVLFGLNGVGKTQLAIKFAYSHLDMFKATQRLGFVDSSMAIDQDKAIKDFAPWLRSCDDEWLIVFDNVDDFKLLTPYWPLAKNGSILVTSRDPAVLQRT
ncbi:hypothetical protein BKA56DRAFT_672173 [Ilyonectria sp. MPI-CAGE-AT-0026]|nr:hypothetical protein BKA56DRAFT_672173 [Ilyonectria sp. MPI-CAGE-AT-0026]